MKKYILILGRLTKSIKNVLISTIQDRKHIIIDKRRKKV